MTAITITDLNNAKLDVDHIAAIATSTAASATDRLGGVKPTLSKTLANVQAFIDGEIAIIGAAVWATEPLGRAAVADGVAFKVQGSGDVAAYEYRRTNSTTSVLIATYPSAGAVAANKAKADAAPTLSPGVNLYDVAVSLTNTILLVAGTTGAQSGWTTSDYIPVNAAAAVSINVQRYCAEYDQNKVFIAGTFYDVAASVQRSFTTNASTKYIRITHTTATTAVQVEYGSASTAFTPFLWQLRDPVGRSVSADRDYGSSAYLAKNDFSYESANLVKSVQTGVYLSGARLTLQAGWVTSDYIPVTASTSYTISRVRFIGFYDSAKVLIGTLVDAVAYGYTTVTPAGAAFMRVTSYQTTWESGGFTINLGTTLTVPVTNLLGFGNTRVPTLNSALRSWLRAEAFTVTSAITRNQFGRPVSPLNIVWPDAATGVLTLVYNTDGAVASMSATHIMGSVVRTVVQPTITYSSGDASVIPAIIVNTI